MPISENLSKAMKQYKEENSLSFEVLAERLGIPKSSTESYYNGTGNPRADTLELLSKGLNIPLEEIVSGPFPGQERAKTILRAAKELSGLPPDRRERGLQLFRELTALFAEGDHT